MANIYARSPYIISINEASQIRTKIEILLFYDGNSLPSSPNYTLSKYIPSSNNTETVYNISPYIREYISHSTRQVTNTYTQLSTSTYVNVWVTRYKDTGSGFVLVDTLRFLGFDGYSDYLDGANDTFSIAAKEEGIYYFDKSDANIPTVVVDCDGGDNAATIVWTPLEGGGSPQTIDLSLEIQPQVVAGFNVSNIAYKNKFEIKDYLGVVKKTYYFYPIEECRYTPVKVEYVNKFGVFDVMWFFKASNTTLSTSSKTYNNLQSSWNYSVNKGQTTTYNKTGREKIKVNSGFVEEAVSSQIKQLMLSERILVAGKPAMLKTDSVEYFKHINQKQINYTLEFEFAYDVINNVI